MVYDAARKKTESERKKYLEPKKDEVFKKKEAARVREYILKKMLEQLQVSTATSTSKTIPTTSSAFSTKQTLSRSVPKTERSHPVCERRPRWLELLPKKFNLRIAAVHNKSGRKKNELSEYM